MLRLPLGLAICLFLLTALASAAEKSAPENFNQPDAEGWRIGHDG